MAKKKSRKVRIPSLRECNGRACADFKGERVYFGKAGTSEAEEAYRRTLALYVANNGSLLSTQGSVTVAELILAYWRDRQDYYRKPDGSHTTSLDRVRQSLKPLRNLYSHFSADDFRPMDLRAIRQGWIDKRLSRKTVNDYTAVVKHLFKWGASHELVSAGVSQALSTVEGLRAGRSEARETEKRRPVAQGHIDAIRPYVSRQIWAMVQIQQLSGARPGEIVNLRPINIKTEGDIWSAQILDHKTAYKGKERVLYFGPKAQAILKPFMADRSLNSFMFSPKEAEKERAERAGSHRRLSQKLTPRMTSRRIGDHYAPDTYRQAVQRGCKKAGIPSWSPHRLRHTAATNFRREYGLDAASAFLGHKEVSMTQHYAELDREKVVEAIKEFG